MELVAGDEGFKEDEESELADAFGAKRVGEPAGSSATTLPENKGGGSDDPAEGAGMVLGTSVRAEQEGGATYEVLGEAVDLICLEGAFKEFAFPDVEGVDVVLEGSNGGGRLRIQNVGGV